MTWTDLQALAASAAHWQQQQQLRFTSLTIDTSIYSGDVTPDTWEWGDLWAVSAKIGFCCCAASFHVDLFSQDYGAVASAMIVNENTFSVSISPAAIPVRARHAALGGTIMTHKKDLRLTV